MTQKDTLGSLFGKARKWAKEELKNATRIGGDPIEHRRAREANEARAEELHRDAEEAAGAAVVEALLPQGVKDWRDQMEIDRAKAQTEREQRAHADRERRAGRASVQMTGYFTASLDGLAVRTTEDSESRTLFVEVETVDPVRLDAGTFVGFTFELPGYHGDGTYELVDEDLDWLQYGLHQAEDNEGWNFHPSYGPGRVVVTDGVADVALVYGNAGSETIRLRAQVQLRS